MNGTVGKRGHSVVDDDSVEVTGDDVRVVDGGTTEVVDGEYEGSLAEASDEVACAITLVLSPTRIRSSANWIRHKTNILMVSKMRLNMVTSRTHRNDPIYD